MVNNYLSIINLILVVTALVIAIIALTNRNKKDGYQKNLTPCSIDHELPWRCCPEDPSKYCGVHNREEIVCKGINQFGEPECIPGYYCNEGSCGEAPNAASCKTGGTGAGAGGTGLNSCFNSMAYCKNAVECQPLISLQSFCDNGGDCVFVNVQFQLEGELSWLTIKNNNCWGDQVKKSVENKPVTLSYNEACSNGPQCISQLVVPKDAKGNSLPLTIDDLQIGCICWPNNNAWPFFVTAFSYTVNRAVPYINIEWQDQKPSPYGEKCSHWTLEAVNSTFHPTDHLIYENIPYYMMCKCSNKAGACLEDWPFLYVTSGTMVSCVDPNSGHDVNCNTLSFTEKKSEAIKVRFLHRTQKDPNTQQGCAPP